MVFVCVTAAILLLRMLTMMMMVVLLYYECCCVYKRIAHAGRKMRNSSVNILFAKRIMFLVVGGKRAK